MSRENIKVEFYYGDEDFDKIMQKIISEKLLYYSITKENIRKMCYIKDNRTTAIYQDKKR